MNYLDDEEVVIDSSSSPIEKISERIVKELIDPSVDYELSADQIRVMRNGVVSIITDEVSEKVIELLV